MTLSMIAINELCILILMSQQNNSSVRCQGHQREACVVDLDLAVLICEKCALYDPFYRHHHFIDKHELPSHVSILYQGFQQSIQSLKLYLEEEGTVSRWKTVEQLSKQALDHKIEDINEMYNQMIAEIEKQRQDKIRIVRQDIGKIMKQSREEVNLITFHNYQQLHKHHQFLKQCLQSSQYLELVKQLRDESTKKVISSIEKDLSIIQVSLKTKLGLLETLPVPNLELLRRKTSTKDQILLQSEFLCPETANFKEKLSSKTERYQMKQIFNNPANKSAETQRLSTINSIQLNAEQDIKLKKNTLKISTKEDLRNIIIKNTIKQIILAGLKLNNREALDALKKCTTNTLVTTVDLSNNQLTSDFIIGLKNQKNYGKQLKKVILKGVNLEKNTVLQKEGINLEALRQGKLKFGQISVIV